MTNPDTIDVATQPTVTSLVMVKTFGILAVLFIIATMLPRKTKF